MRPRVGELAALLVAGTTLGCQASGSQPGFVVFPEMYQSVSVKPYEKSGVSPAGQALRLPPEGSVPVGGVPFAYGAGPEEAKRAGAELRNPLDPTPDNLKRGQRVYETVCIVCHGRKAEGDGPIIGRFPNPPSLLAERARRLPDGQVYHVISRGQGIMPAHALQVLPEDRWRVILHLRQLQGGTAEPAAQ